MVKRQTKVEKLKEEYNLLSPKWKKRCNEAFMLWLKECKTLEQIEELGRQAISPSVNWSLKKGLLHLAVRKWERLAIFAISGAKRSKFKIKKIESLCPPTDRVRELIRYRLAQL